MKHTTIAVDLAKTIFEIAVSDRPGHVTRSLRLSRSRFLRFFAEHGPATVVLEACGTAHYWGRHLRKLGHQVVLLPPYDVRPYVRRNKTDRADAKGLLEAYRNEAIHPVPVKEVSHQGVAAMHRLRSTWLATRTSRINTLRGILREIGFTIPVGAHHVVPRVESLASAPDSELPDTLRPFLIDACREIRACEQRMKTVESQLRRLQSQLPTVRRLQTIPGVGLLTSTALVGFVTDVRRFPSGRHFASYLGLTPREFSTGAVRRLGRISKRGDAYLRMLLIHGARAVLNAAKKKSQPDRLRAWALSCEQRRGHNKAAVALANKMARIAWSVWKRDRTFVEHAAA
jgi:transposase